MILLNTTFACDPALEAEVIGWIKDTYLPRAIVSGLFADPLLCKVHPMPDADASSIAVQMRCGSVADANTWLHGEGARITADFAAGRHERIMAFATLMDILDVAD